MSSIEICKTIRELIADSGLKQKKVAEKAGYAEKEFSSILNGRKRLDAVDVYRISQALSVTPNELFGIERPANKSQ